MSKKRKSQVAGLLKRYEFTDFAQVVATPSLDRKQKLAAYLDRSSKGRWPSYKGFRSMIPDLVGVQRGLDTSEPLDLIGIKRGLKARCHEDDFDRNLEAALTLQRHLGRRGFTAYSDHPKNPLHISADRTISFGVQHYIVEGDRGVFQFVNPRRQGLDPDARRIAMSLVHHNYVRDDFDEFQVELIELGHEQEVGPRGGIRLGTARKPRTFGLDRSEIADREWLSEQANSVYEILMELSAE